MSTKVLLPCVIAGVAILALVLSGCTPSDTSQSQGFPGLEKYRSAKTQLFESPESKVPHGNSFVTAYYLAEDEKWVPSEVRQLHEAPTDVPLGTLEGAVAYLSLLAGRHITSINPDAEKRIIVTLSETVFADEPGAKVAQINAYAKIGNQLRALGVTHAPSPALKQAMDSIDLAALTPHPYLMYRFQAALRAAKPQDAGKIKSIGEALVAACKDYEPKLATVQEVLDTRALIDCLPAPHKAEIAAQAQALVASNAVTDDLAMASLLRLSTNTATPQAAAKTVQDILSARLDPNTKLITPLETSSDPIDATYKLARILDQKFVSVSNPTMLASTYAIMTDGAAPASARMKAALVLKRANDARWSEIEPTSKTALAAMSQNVTAANLADYLYLAEIATQLDPDRVRPALALSPSEQEHLPPILALQTLAYAYMFSNGEKVGRMFATVQAHLKDSLTEVTFTQNVIEYVAAYEAIPSAELAGVDINAMTQTTARIQDLAACGGVSFMLRTAAAPDAPCSLSLTFMAHSVTAPIVADAKISKD